MVVQQLNDIYHHCHSHGRDDITILHQLDGGFAVEDRTLQCTEASAGDRSCLWCRGVWNPGYQWSGSL